MADFTRRSMIRTAALVPLLAKAGCARRISPNRSLLVAAPIDGEVTIPLGQAPELASGGGAVVVRPAGPAGGFLVANTGSGYLALSARCPHEGCDVAWVAEDREVECPCHGSRFAGDGTVLNPPAREDLQSFPVEPDGQGNLVVHLFAGTGALKDLRVQGGKFSFAVADFPALANVGGIVAGRPTGFPTPLLITRLAAGAGPDALGAVNAICTHLSCTVLPGAGRLQCPCHGSEFELSGAFISGPAGPGNNLFRYAVAFDGTTATVSTDLRT